MAVFLLISLFLTFTLTNTQELVKCSTPNSTEGTCIEIKSCKALLTVLTTRPMTPQSLRYLTRSQCGFDEENNQPMVCCPSSDQPRPFLLPIQAPPRRPPVNLDNRFGENNILPTIEQCGVQIFSDRIFDGIVTGLDEFPWMALLEYKVKDRVGRGFACGGTLINNRYVLTAAHCVIGNSAASLGGLQSVRLGEHNIDSVKDCFDDFEDESNSCAPPPIDVKVESIHPHPEYKPSEKNRYHDIALVRLVRSVEFHDFVQPICLPPEETASALTAPGKKQFIAGWGQTEKGMQNPIKLKAIVPVVNNVFCSNTYQKIGLRVNTEQICAGGGKADSCRGDSGGPLMAASVWGNYPHWFATGIVSYGPRNCAIQGIPGVYTRISNYIPWIKSTLRP